MTAIALAGDWHGNKDWALRCLRHLSALGVREVFHLGDFGIWPGPKGRDFVLDAYLASEEMVIFVTPGNHDDYDQIAELPALDLGRDMGAVQWMTDHIALLPRNHRFSRGGWSFVSLGGAPSIDFEYRARGEQWWDAELITNEQVEAVVAAGPADVMLAHDAPDTDYATGAVGRILATNPMGYSVEALTYCAVGRMRMTQAFLAVQPRVFVHGHYHVRDERVMRIPGWNHYTEMVSVDGDHRVDGNLVLLHLPERDSADVPTIEWLDVPDLKVPDWERLDLTPRRHPRTWGTEAMLIALNRGGSAHWDVLVDAVTREPHASWVNDLKTAMAKTQNRCAHMHLARRLQELVDFDDRRRI